MAGNDVVAAAVTFATIATSQVTCNQAITVGIITNSLTSRSSQMLPLLPLLMAFFVVLFHDRPSGDFLGAFSMSPGFLRLYLCGFIRSLIFPCLLPPDDASCLAWTSSVRQVDWECCCYSHCGWHRTVAIRSCPSSVRKIPSIATGCTGWAPPGEKPTLAVRIRDKCS